MTIKEATMQDIQALLDLQKLAFLPIAQRLQWYDMPNIHETFAMVKKEFSRYLILKLLSEEGIIVGSVRGRTDSDSLYISRLMVLPEYQHKGFGRMLLHTLETTLPHQRAWLTTCEQLGTNVQFYQKEGFQTFRKETINEKLNRVFMEKIKDKLR